MSVKTLLAVLLLALPAWAGPVEQRCTEIDGQPNAQCDCSEPLDTATYTRTVNQCGSAYLMDPDDSEGVGAKECGTLCNGSRQEGGAHDPDVYSHFVAPTGMPVGATVGNVFDWTQPNPNEGSDAIKGRMDLITSATRRVCMRYYMQDKSTVNWGTQPCPPEDPSNSGFKLMQFLYLGELQVSMGGAYGSGFGFWVEGGSHGFSGPDAGDFFPSWDSNPPTSAALRPEDCFNEWCIIELCVAGNVQAGTNLTADYHHRNMSGTHHYDKIGIQIGNSNAGSGITDIQPLMLYGDRCTVGRRFSHVMQASWDNDAGQTIGPAYEIEGGSGGGNPPVGVAISHTPAGNTFTAPIAGITFTATADPLHLGTGPHYRFTLDCNANDAITTPEGDSGSINDATPGPYTFSASACDGIYANASPPNGYAARVTLEDYGTGTVGVDPILSSNSDSEQIIVNGSASQCPAVPPATKGIVTGFKLWDATNSGPNDTVITDPFTAGSTISRAAHPNIAFEAATNTYLSDLTTNHPGSVLIHLDGVRRCENAPPYSSAGDNGPNDFNIDTAALTPDGAHQIIAQSYDTDGCENGPGGGAPPGAAGVPVIVNYTVVP